MTSSPAPRFKVGRDYNGKFKWELRNARDEVIAEAPVGFAQKKKAVEAIDTVRDNFNLAKTIEVEV